MSNSRLVRVAVLVLLAGSLTRCDCGHPSVNGDGGGGGAGGGTGADCTDGDGDGFGTGSTCLGPDCDDADPAVHPGAAEACNGRDDNCNGQVDEGLADLACGTGACARTVPACVGGAPQTCTPGAPGTETCNGVDDDCNGVVDDGPAAQALPCVTGQDGVCAPGLTQCSDGGVACVPQLTAHPEACNGLDDNCNGAVDEQDPDGGAACDTGLQGACRSGVQHCLDGGLGCVALAQPRPEACNGLDDDCNGLADDGNPDAGMLCSTGLLGRCAAGSTTCADGGLLCLQLYFAAGAETCNGLDDTCDGVVDEGNPGGNVSCTSGLQGVCAPGATACLDGGVQCVPTVSPAPEACNGLDDNCNGVIDEGDPDGGAACATGLLGRCATGATACQSPDVVCTQTVQPSPEVCNGLDDNCDGVVDEGNPDGGVDCATGLLGQCGLGSTACDDGGVLCVQLIQPAVEACDGLDNDCDGTVDNGNPGSGIACTTGRLGVCAAGSTACRSGAIVCGETVQPSAEVCNGLDDDCNGVIDEGNPGGGAACSTGQPGVCGPGVETCTGGAVVCRSTTPASAEVCDGLDNDCDGTVDNGNPGGGVACDTGLQGVCAAGTTACTAGGIVCNQNVQPSVELCDGLDNDCDGLIDNGGPGSGASCSTGQQGVCAAGTTACTAGAIVCNRTTGPSAEVCDGRDNDCDGAVDNGNPGGGASCSTGLMGVCAPGVTVCTGGAVACAGLVGPSPEVCDGLDNDCNGAVDDGNPGGGVSCATGLQGVCAAGTTACTTAGLVCTQNVPPSVEVCDGLDNDCDGMIDNGNPGGGASCSTGLLGVCAAGTTACTAGAVACSQNAPPSAEVCNGLDDNCDGVVDEGNPGGGLACSTGLPGVCAAGTTVCSAGAVACSQNLSPSVELCDGLDNNCDGLVDNGVSLPDGHPNSCALASAQTYTVNPGGAIDVTGYIDASGDDYFVVNFILVPGPGGRFHPNIILASNPGGNFKLQVLTSCAASPTCAGVWDSWEMSYPASPNNCAIYGNCVDLTPRPTSVIVRVTRVAGAPNYCGQYIVNAANI